MHIKVSLVLKSLLCTLIAFLCVMQILPRGEDGRLTDTEGIIQKSAMAFDSGSDTYSVDEKGRIWLNDNAGNKHFVLDAHATAIGVRGNALYFASSHDGLHGISLLNITTGAVSRLFDTPQPISAFSVDGDIFYYLCGSAVYSRKDSEGQDYKNERKILTLDNTSFIELKDSSTLLLYTPDPNYDINLDMGAVESADCEEFEEGTNEWIVYSYGLDTGVLALYSAEPAQIIASETKNTINGIAVPFEDYPVGSFFTKNGKHCSCHNKGINCVASGSRCNCMRYWPTGVKSTCEVDLLGVQCMGFARFCQWRLFGNLDYGSYGEKYFTNILGGNVSSGKWTANSLRASVLQAGLGAHIRVSSNHSLIVISISATGFTTYECNSPINGRQCMVFTRDWTWSSFYSYYKSSGLLYINVPKEYVSVEVPDEYLPGTYIILADPWLNIRSEPSTSGEKLGTLSTNTIVTVDSVKLVDDEIYWGHIEHNGISGWISLEYANYLRVSVSSINIISFPTKQSYIRGETFDPTGLEVQAIFVDGTSRTVTDYTLSGYDMNKAGNQTVKVSYAGFSATFPIEVILVVVPPTSVTLYDESQTLLKNDTIAMQYTLLPANTTMTEVYWSSSNNAIATVSDSGVVTAISNGVATITVTTENGLTDTFVISVTSMPSGTNWSDWLDEIPQGISVYDYTVEERDFYLANGSDTWTDTKPSGEYETKKRYRFRSICVIYISDGSVVKLEAADIYSYVSPDPLKDDGRIFAGWFKTASAAEELDISQAHASSVYIHADTYLYAGWITVEDVERDVEDDISSAGTLPGFALIGTDLKISDTDYGIRFFTRISKKLIETIESLNKDNLPLAPTSLNDKDIGYGTVVRRRSSVDGYLEKGSSRYNTLSSGRPITVPAANVYGEFSDYIIYTALVTGYEAQYVQSNYAARPYITYADANGNIQTYYFTYKGSSAVGGGHYTNLYKVARALYASSAADFATKKWIEENIYAFVD